MVIDTGVSNIPKMFAGTYTGRVVKTDQSTRTNVSAAIPYQVTLPFLTYGNEWKWKTLERVSLSIQPKNANSITFAWTRDGNAQQTVSMTQGGGDVLG